MHIQPASPREKHHEQPHKQCSSSQLQQRSSDNKRPLIDVHGQAKSIHRQKRIEDSEAYKGKGRI